jgi:predicted 3-demethylubiquinone-9 3-methyltransferase (glyoxalase superfamily)
MEKIVTSLWFEKDVEEAVNFYVSLLPSSHVDLIGTLAAETPSGPPGSVKMINFTLMGQPFFAMEAGKLDPFNHAISLTVNCDTQEEIDRLWDALSEGGTVEQCGWLKDRYGVSWQIVPSKIIEMMSDEDQTRARRVAEAMLQMVKFDIAELERAFAG